MFRGDTTESEAMGEAQGSTPAEYSRTPSFDDIASQPPPDALLPPPPPPPTLAPALDVHRRRESSRSGLTLRSTPLVATQPQAVLDMRAIQAHAEALEMQTRRALEATQRLAEQHFEAMLDSRGFRVTHACEHCRQRKAKHERRRVFAGALFADVAPQPGEGGVGPGPMRAARTREARSATASMPYALRRNTAPEHLLREGGPSSSALQPNPVRDLRSSVPPPPQQLVRPTPVRLAAAYDQRRDSLATEAAHSFDYALPPRSGSPHPTRWAEPTAHRTSTPQPRPALPTRSVLQHALAARTPPLPSTLGRAWADDRPTPWSAGLRALQTPSSLTQDQRLEESHGEGKDEGEGDRDRRWSTDGNFSEDAVPGRAESEEVPLRARGIEGEGAVSLETMMQRGGSAGEGDGERERDPGSGDQLQ
ncbi:conserved hypothetical protein [Sporisorium reilianum SRZ2]|uniref:Uncharacterized protein n=1 Tax=Sporisorium reilianum (strain SRZ2) TaxID=999809 RepID=E6ZM81_SPORE|nr:conserved hypothetical protein [Sporisorium reilianum SRZ2]